jgi:hypothetical protein
MGLVERQMPLARYFVWVGSVLLALLFIADAYLPKLPDTGNANAARRRRFYAGQHCQRRRRHQLRLSVGSRNDKEAA